MNSNQGNYHYQQIGGNVYNKILRNSSAYPGTKQLNLNSFNKISNVDENNSKLGPLNGAAVKSDKNIKSSIPRDKLFPANLYNFRKPSYIPELSMNNEKILLGTSKFQDTTRVISTANPALVLKSNMMLPGSIKNPPRSYINCNNNFSKSLPRNGLNIINSKQIQNRDLTRKNESKENISLYVPSAKSVSEFAYKEERNSEHRENMEDFHKILDGFIGDNAKGFFSIYDGHGGSEPVKYAKDRLPEIFGKFLLETNHNIEKSLLCSFQKLDDELKLFPECENVGTTATIVYISKTSDIISGSRKVAYCANVGDSKCALISSDSCKSLSTDHKCTDENEVARIKKSGGVVFNGRVFGQLAITRALGDHSMKKYGVVCTPSIARHVICEKDKFIVICSDGVWDVVSEDEVFEIGNEYSSANEIASVLVKKSIERESRDNISCIVIKL